MSLDLDLHEKSHKLISSGENMKRQYILRLRELIFAHVRAIGNLILGSRLENAWIEAEWFNSESVVRQVLECKDMVRGIKAHEKTAIAIDNLVCFIGVAENIVQIVNKAINGNFQLKRIQGCFLFL